MPKVRCKMGEACGQSHGVSSAHWENVTQNQINQWDEELIDEELINEVAGPIDWPNAVENW